MSLKLKKLTEFVNPSPSEYDPKDILTKPLNQRPINYRSKRSDFSKSITGRQVGPGGYEVRTREQISLGKIGKSDKFLANKNRNVIFILFSLVQVITKSQIKLEPFQSIVRDLRR